MLLHCTQPAVEPCTPGGSILGVLCSRTSCLTNHQDSVLPCLQRFSCCSAAALPDALTADSSKRQQRSLGQLLRDPQYGIMAQIEAVHNINNLRKLLRIAQSRLQPQHYR